MVCIKEVFASIQGEGPLVGYKQIFIRFCRCNLNCSYCDTDFDIVTAKDFSVTELIEQINCYKNCHSISLTGGEPLLELNFLKEFLPLCHLPIFLETNATLYKNLLEVIDFIKYVSADIKLPSCTGLKPLWIEHENFFEIAKQKMLYAKVVFDENILDEEIMKVCEICKKYDVELVLQPKMIGTKLSVSSDFIEKTLDKFLVLHKKSRLIPQVHKFLNVL